MSKAASGSLLFYSWSDYCHSFPLYISLMGDIHLVVKLVCPFLFSWFSLITPFRKPVYFSLQSSIAGYQSCQGSLCLLPKNLPLRHVEERIFRILLARTGRQSRGQKK